MSINRGHTISILFARVKGGDGDAFMQLCDLLHNKLSCIARRKIADVGTARHALDEEDVLSSVFLRLWSGSQKKHFDDYTCSDELWRLLVKITHGKVIDRVRRERRQKRDVAKNLQLEFELTDDQWEELYLCEVRDTFEFLLGKIEEDQINLRTIVLRLLEGYSAKEIAGELGVSQRTVKRRVDLIKDIWDKYVEDIG